MVCFYERTLNEDENRGRYLTIYIDLIATKDVCHQSASKMSHLKPNGRIKSTNTMGPTHQGRSTVRTQCGCFARMTAIREKEEDELILGFQQTEV
jgi:hypothetical protein